MKKITAIVPVYNTKDEYLKACIQSLVKQSYKNSQIILIDDGSNIYTRCLCDELAKCDDRIEVIHQANAGPSIARNTGLRRANGNFLTFVDSDDWLMPETWEKVIETMEQRNADCAVFGWTCIKEREAQISKVVDEITLISAKDALCQIAGDNEACGGGYPWNKIWNADVLRSQNAGQLPLFDTKLFAYEDKEWILRALRGLNSVVLLPESFYKYRFVSTSLTNASERWEKRQYNAYLAYNQILDELAQTDQEAWRNAANFYFYFCATDLYNQCRHPSWYGGWKRCRRTKKSLFYICQQVPLKYLDSWKKRCAWIIMQIWGRI